MINRETILAHVNNTYGIEADYPWVRAPNYAILRHTINRKWFMAIIDVTEDKLGLNGTNLVDALLLKCDPLLIGSLRSEPGILPGYHMNKEHWITVLLNGDVPIERIYELIDFSYGLTRSKKRR